MSWVRVPPSPPLLLIGSTFYALHYLSSADANREVAHIVNATTSPAMMDNFNAPCELVRSRSLRSHR